MTKKRIIGLAIASFGVIAVGGVVFMLRSSSDVVVVEDLVRRGNLVQTVEVTGDVRSVQDVALSFEASGTVSRIAVEEGAAVEAGDVLATLRASDLAAEVTRAEAALDKLYAGASTEERAVAEAAVVVARATYDAAVADVVYVEATTAAAVAEAETAVQSAMYAQSTNGVDAARGLVQAREDYREAVEVAVIDIRSGLAEADEVLGVENTLLNNQFEDELSARDEARFRSATRAYQAAMSARTTAEDAVYALTSSSDDAMVAAAAASVEEGLDAVALTLLYTSQVLDATFGDSVNLSTETLLAFKTSITVARTSVQTAMSTLTGAEQAFLSAQEAVDAQSTTGTSAYDAAVSALASARATQTRSVAQAQAAVASRAADLAQAQASYAQVMASPRYEDIRAAEADVLAAQARYAKTQIIAPVSGVVTNLDIDAGEQVAAGAVIAELQALDGQFEVLVSIPESDVAAISVGDAAEITLDAFGDSQQFAATVGRIDPAETVIEGVTFYEARLYFADAQTPAGIKSGMSADVTISTDARVNVLYVPQRAVMEDGERRYVRIPTNTKGEYVTQDVTVGMRGDDGLLEILSGVTEGDRVIVTIR